MSTNRAKRVRAAARSAADRARGETLGRLLQRHLGLRDRGIRRLHLLDREVPLDLELAEIAEQRAGLRGEPLSLRLQRADAIVHPPRERIGRGAVRRLRDERGRLAAAPTTQWGAVMT